MQNTTSWFLALGAMAAAFPAVTPSAHEAAASAEPWSAARRHDTGSMLIHVVRAGDTLNRLAAVYREPAGWYSQADLLGAIRKTNDPIDERNLRIGRMLMIPRWKEHATPRARRPVEDGSDFRGIYLPGPILSTQHVFARVDSFIERGGNGVVFDAKDIDGGLNYRSAHALASFGLGRTAPAIADLAGLVRRLRERDLWVVARLALFLDGELGVSRPDLALRGPDGQPWTERGCVWLDPIASEVRRYNLTLAVELAMAGVDEVQLDYVRYPTNGWRGDCQDGLAAATARRREAITSFVASVHDTLSALGCLLSADLYGIMAWDREEDLALTGQHVPSLARHLDVICPMIYPSHFAPGFEGMAHPADHPEYLVSEGVRRFRAQAGGRALIRPWLQAFPWRVTAYGSRYVRVQIDAALEAGADGWSLWSPAGRYEKAQEALVQKRPPSAQRPAIAITAADSHP